MTVVVYGVDHGVDGLLNVVNGDGESPRPPLLLPESAQKGHAIGPACFVRPVFNCLQGLLKTCSSLPACKNSISTAVLNLKE